MRFHYLSDLHLESQDFPGTLPQGETLIIAGDLCHATCLDPARKDPYAIAQRDRVRRFADMALARFRHVVLIAGNHDHYDGVFEDTVPALARALPGMTVLDDDAVEMGGVTIFGSTLWSDFEGGEADALKRARKGCGEFFFVKTRDRESGALSRFRPDDALAAHRRALQALERVVAADKPLVVVSHHAPSRHGLNPKFSGNGLDGAYGSDLDQFIAAHPAIKVWVHGHTHIRKTYRIGATEVRVNCRGFDGKDAAARGFKPDQWFEI